ncbi:MAG: hypothetical protein HFE41_03470 [Clostridia bacterium]|jgi:uncharacterized spore protein YtfJ|nr:hypothetical protein [Clostridia bacterium]
MNSKIKKNREKEFDAPAISIEKVAEADTVIGKSIITVSGTEVIPLSSVTVVNLSGGGEYGDVKTFKEADGFQMAGGNGTVISVKPKGFLIDDGKGCRLLKMEDGAIDTLIEKTGELVHKLTDNV